jgi:hypothetical protein
MATTATLASKGCFDRRIWLFDTFAGMTPPTEHDADFGGARVQEQSGVSAL